MEIIGMIIVCILVVALILVTALSPVHGEDPYPDVTDFSQEEDLLLKWTKHRK